jgi:GGDEF domain-containing protein
VRDVDVVARSGGDEFALLVIDDDVSPDRLGRQIVQTVEVPQWSALRIGHSPDPSSPTLRLTPGAMKAFLAAAKGHKPSTRLTARIGRDVWSL